MKIFSFLIAIFITAGNLAAQDTMRELTLVLEKTIPLQADVFYGADDIDAVYYSVDHVFYKKTPVLTTQFYDILLGELTSVDLINPFKLLLFYRETQTVVLLDNRLNEIERVTLSDLEPYRFIQYASIAGEKQLWLFNLDEKRLERYDYINNRSLPFSQSVTEPVINMVSTYNFCHVQTANTIYSFNSYGGLTNSITTSENSSINASYQALLKWKTNAIEIWKLGRDASLKPSHRTENLPSVFKDQNTAQTLYLKAGKLYLYGANSISVFETNLLKN